MHFPFQIKTIDLFLLFSLFLRIKTIVEIYD